MATWSTQSAVRECQMAANGELTVVERLATLLETGQFADVSIKVGKGNDTQVFKAHRLLLATASQPLSKLVSSSYENGSGDSAPIIVNDIDPESFQHVLKYIYTDDVKINAVTEALALLRISQEWSLEPLKQKTVKFVNQFLQEFEPISEEMKNDICELLIYTESSEDHNVNGKCWEVLFKHVNEIVPCQGYLNFTEPILRKLLAHKDFQYKNQLVLFEAIRDWGMNQVLMRNLNVDQLQPLISELLKYVNFGAIKDKEFLRTVIPSECLSKSDLISFFLSRGMDIPRDLAYDSSLEMNNNESEFEKAIRFKRGYKISDQEIYKEHELRFRVDKNLKLLGVVFGFLFSNTDMGITVHCQGPWERREWTDIIQTYCRVSYGKMKSADVRLMFSEPVLIEANHSYKILVRVSRMSAGTSEVELWGGGEGQPSVKTKDAVFNFLKSAVDPTSEVQEKDRDNAPSMITELVYQQEDYEPPAKKEEPSAFTPKQPSPPKLTKRFPNLSIKRRASREEATGDRDAKLTRPAIVNVEDEETPKGTSDYRRTRPPQPKTPVVETPKPSSPWQSKMITSRTPKVEDGGTTPSTKPKLSVPGTSEFTTPKEKKSLEPSKIPWMIPSRSRTDNFLSKATRESSVSRAREPSVGKTQDYKPCSRTTSGTKYDSGIPSRYVGNYSQSPSYLRLSNTGLSTASRRGQVTPAAAYGKDTGLSSDPSSSILAKSVSSFLNKTSKYRQPSPAPHGKDSTSSTSAASKDLGSSSRFGPTSSSRIGQTSSSSIGQKADGLTSRIREGTPLGSTSKDTPSMRSDVKSSWNPPEKTASKYGSSATDIGSSSRLGGAVSSLASKLGHSTSKYSNPSASSLGDKDYSTSSSSRFGPSSSLSSTSRFGSSPSSLSSRLGTSRFTSGLSSIYNPTSSRYGSSYRR